MRNRFIEMVLPISILIFIFTIAFLGLENDSLKRKNKNLHDQLDECTEIANKDCLNWLAGERNILKSEGCYQGLGRFCSETDRPKTCMDKVSPMCYDLDEN